MSVAKSTDLRQLFAPRGIVVVGVTERETNLALRFTRALQRHGYPGDLAVVNRHGDDVEGIPGYGAIADVTGQIDLAIVSVRADLVEDAIHASADAGAAGVLLYSSGYAEVGGDGIQRQRRLIEIARERGVRLLGPNCVGFVNVRANTAPMASGFAYRPSIEPGRLAIVTQSGGVAGLLAERSQDVGIGLSHVITTGNEGDVTAAEIVEFLALDEATEQIALYLEAVRSPERLTRALAIAVERGCGVAVFKAGAGTRTAAAAAAHTGSLVGDDASFDALCRQTGACRVHDLDDLFLVPPIISAVSGAGPRVGVLSISGGAAVSVADACEREGLGLPPLSAETAAKVAEITPGFASLQNPVDISGTFVVAMEQFQRSLEVLSNAPEFDAVALVQTVHPPALADTIADVIIAGADPRRAVVVWIAGTQSAPARAKLRRAGFAVTERAGPCALALRAVREIAERRGGRPVLALPEAGVPSPPPMRPSEIMDALAARGASVAPMRVVTDAENAVAVARQLGYPVVLKADAADVSHKTERGGVIVGIADEAELRASFARLEAAGLTSGGALLQAAVAGNRELLVTVRRDPVFGLVLVLGAGGVLTEAFGRAAVALPPFDPPSIQGAVVAAGIERLVGEFRGAAALDLRLLAELAEACLGLARELGSIEYLELNPVIVSADGRPYVVDALIDPSQQEGSDSR
jgi:acyl-CoA synthetase (NDP forming)